jgi:RsiW-degrading membrane proteinase PrsW (M82 family)
MAWTPDYFAALAVFPYFGAGVVEEGIKYVALRLAVFRAPLRHEYGYLVYAAMAGLGYATIEKGESAGMIGLPLFGRIVFASIGHTVMALLTGLQLIRRYAQGENLPVSVLYHGTWDFALFSLSAWSGDVGWIHPTDAESLVLNFSHCKATPCETS